MKGGRIFFFFPDSALYSLHNMLPWKLSHICHRIYNEIVNNYNAEVDEYNRIVEGNKPYVVDKYIKNKE